MEEYLSNYNNYDKSIVYSFEIRMGGIGDCVKFFMAVLNECIATKKKVRYLVTGAPVEEFLVLMHPQFYITRQQLVSLNNYIIRAPMYYYNLFNYDQITIPINTIFKFSDIIVNNERNLLPVSIDYSSIHVRLGDKFLETDKQYVLCKNDNRGYNEAKLDTYIANTSGNIILFADNKEFKLRMKNKHNNITILNSNIGHTSLTNTTRQQIIDTITEFSIITKSSAIAVNTESGFSMAASKFNQIPVIKLY